MAAAEAIWNRSAKETSGNLAFMGFISCRARPRPVREEEKHAVLRSVEGGWSETLRRFGKHEDHADLVV
jgi:hypothetical protein